MQRLTNRQRADNDRTFKVSITGFSRGNWSLVMQILNECVSEKDKQNDPECVKVLQGILKSLESHIVDNHDGYSLGGVEHDTKPISDLENEALKNARIRRAAELKAMEEFEKEYKRAQNKKRRPAQIATPSQPAPAGRLQ